MDKLVAMQTFAAIVDAGTLSAAARTTGRSLPSVVRTLAALEASLGATLLRRTTRRMSLTDEGRLFLDRCRRIVADVAEAEAAVGAGLREPRGPLRITAPVLFGQKHVAPALVELVRRHPGIEVELLLHDRLVDLVDEGVDAAIRIAKLPDSSMVALPLTRMRRVVCGSPELVRKVGKPSRPEELALLPCLHFQGLTPRSTWSFDRGGSEVVLPVKGRFTTNQAVVAVEACVAGLGFGRFLAYQVADAVAQGLLVVVLASHEPPPIPVSVVYTEARLVSSRLRVFLDAMREQLRGLRFDLAPASASKGARVTSRSARRRGGGLGR